MANVAIANPADKTGHGEPKQGSRGREIDRKEKKMDG